MMGAMPLPQEYAPLAELHAQMAEFDAIQCSHEDKIERNDAFRKFVAEREVIISHFRRIIPHLEDFEETAMKWLFALDGFNKAERNVALLYIDHVADPDSLNYLLYILMNESAGNPQYIILNTLNRLFQNLTWEQISVLQHGIQMYRSKLAKPGSDRDNVCEILCQKITTTLSAGETMFRQERRLNAGGITSNHNGLRFRRLHSEMGGLEVTELTLRDCLAPPVYRVFDTYDKALTLPQRALRLWTSDICYREMNRAIILDRQSLRMWMPLICLIIEQMRREPVEHQCRTTRGSKLSPGELEAAYVEGAEMALSMFTASSLKPGTSDHFSDHGVKIHFIIPAGCQCATIVNVSEFDGEAEVLIAPYTLVKCLSKTATEVTLEVQNRSLLDEASTTLA